MKTPSKIILALFGGLLLFIFAAASFVGSYRYRYTGVIYPGVFRCWRQSIRIND